jgi:hypothetical protein
MTRPPALLAVSTALAALALAGCGASGSASSASGTVGATASVAAPSSPDVLASAASSAADQLKAVKDCLQKANLPTPTSTDAAGLLQEVPKLIQNPQVRQALKDCNVNLPGLG